MSERERENRGMTVACNVSYLFFPHRSPEFDRVRTPLPGLCGQLF